MQSVKPPKQMCFKLQVQMSKLELLYSVYGVDLSFLVLAEVEIQESTQLEGKPLPQCKPSASKRDATSEEEKKIRPKPLHEF